MMYIIYAVMYKLRMITFIPAPYRSMYAFCKSQFYFHLSPVDKEEDNHNVSEVVHSTHPCMHA